MRGNHRSDILAHTNVVMDAEEGPEGSSYVHLLDGDGGDGVNDTNSGDDALAHNTLGFWGGVALCCAVKPGAAASTLYSTP